MCNKEVLKLDKNNKLPKIIGIKEASQEPVDEDKEFLFVKSKSKK